MGLGLLPGTTLGESGGLKSHAVELRVRDGQTPNLKNKCENDYANSLLQQLMTKAAPAPYQTTA